MQKKWATKTAPKPAKLIPKGGYGLTFWIFCLMGKYVFHTPLNRLCMQLAMKGLIVPSGTIVVSVRWVRRERGPNEWKTSSQGRTTPCPDVKESLTLPAVLVSNETAVSRVRKA